MLVRILISLILVSTTSGCSTYDVLALSADAALSFFDDDDTTNYYDDDRNRIWDAEISDCIQVEKSKNVVARQLDSIEQGKDFVTLPTGEIYAVAQNQQVAEPTPGPTKKCMAVHSG